MEGGVREALHGAPRADGHFVWPGSMLPAMKSAVTFQEFYQEIFSEIRAIPRRGLAYAAAISVASAALELCQWSYRPALTTIDWIADALLAILSVITTYTLAMMMLKRDWTLLGLGKFFATLLLVISLAALSLGLLLAAGWAHNDLGLLGSVALMFAGIILMALLAGWPVLQTISARWIGPFQALKATRGLRWPLILISFLSGALGRVSPDLSKATDLASACAMAVGSGVIDGLALILAAGIGVVAARHMDQADPRPAAD